MRGFWLALSALLAVAAGLHMRGGPAVVAAPATPGVALQTAGDAAAVEIQYVQPVRGTLRVINRVRPVRRAARLSGRMVVGAAKVAVRVPRVAVRGTYRVSRFAVRATARTASVVVRAPVRAARGAVRFVSNRRWYPGKLLVRALRR